MTARIKKSISRFGLTFLVLIVVLLWNSGCVTSKPDPLAGWTFKSFPGWGMNPNGHNNNILAKAITDDYQDFIIKNKLNLSGAVTGFYEDGTGQHAVQFAAFPPNQNATWTYALIYDKENKRIKVIKYDYHRFQS
jgi:hypothetical protein